MNVSTTAQTGLEITNTAWLRVVQIALAVGIAASAALTIVSMGWKTSSGGPFMYAADYWYTGLALPLAAGSLFLALGVHRLHHGRDSMVGLIGVWVNGVACSVLFAQCLASVVVSTELQWGPTYVICSFLTFAGLALLSVGSWRAGLVPKWILGVWPAVWIIGSFLSQGPTSILLTGFYIVFLVIITGRNRQLVAVSLPRRSRS
jgi:hypothetical protein